MTEHAHSHTRELYLPRKNVLKEQRHRKHTKNANNKITIALLKTNGKCEKDFITIKANRTVVKFYAPNYMGLKHQGNSIRKAIKHSWIF